MTPQIKRLGTIDCDLVETTPIVFKDRLYRFEYVRKGYWGNQRDDVRRHPCAIPAQLVS